VDENSGGSGGVVINDNGIAIGTTLDEYVTGAIGIGNINYAGNNAICIGNGSRAGLSETVAIGFNASTMNYANAIAIGSTNTTDSNQVAIGNDDITTIRLGTLSIYIHDDTIVFMKGSKRFTMNLTTPT
jgi:hypothetical protein